MLKIYYFDPAGLDIKQRDNVMLKPQEEVEYGKVVLGLRQIEDDKIIQPLKPVIRLATPEDDEIERKNKRKRKPSDMLRENQKDELEMKLIDSEYTFDNNKVLFYFTADGRIDFRELVRPSFCF